MRPLQRVQNSAARLVTLTRKFDSITPVLAELHWLPVQERIKYKILLMTFKCIHNLAPGYLSDLLHIHTSSRQLRSSSSLTLTLPRTQTPSIGNRAFSVSGPHLWNKLPGTLRNSTSLTQFRRLLKHHLYTEYFF